MYSIQIKESVRDFLRENYRRSDIEDHVIVEDVYKLYQQQGGALTKYNFVKIVSQILTHNTMGKRDGAVTIRYWASLKLKTKEN